VKKKESEKKGEDEKKNKVCVCKKKGEGRSEKGEKKIDDMCVLRCGE
jgi:hypothetical protein